MANTFQIRRRPYPLRLAAVVWLGLALTPALAQERSTAPHPLEVEGATVWPQVERSHWIQDGSDKAPRIVYVLTDPNCPFCNKLWVDARPWVSAGKVQLRHVMVGILTATSAGKAAALLADKEPAAALVSHERANVASNAKVMSSGRPQPLGNDGVKPLSHIPAAVQAQLDANETLMVSLRLRATPALIWRDEKGAVKARTGASNATLVAAFGAL